MSRVPASLKFTVPLMLLVFAAVLSAVNLLYHVPRAERAAEDDSRKRLGQEMSRLQSTLEYLFLKGDTAGAQREIAVQAHNHDVVFGALTDDNDNVIAATRRAWIGRQIEDVLPQFDLRTARDAGPGMTIDSKGVDLVGHANILLGPEREQLAPSRKGSVFLAYDLQRYKAEARAQVIQQSLYWAGWVAALALAMWLAFHFLLTRRTARLVAAAEQLAAGNLAARSNLKGTDELGRLSRAFDAMALEVAETQTRLRQDLEERMRQADALRVSEASYRAIFDSAEDAIFVHDIDTGAIVDVNPKACASFGYTREEMRGLDIGTLGTGERPYTQQDAMELIGRAAAGEQLRIEWLGRFKDGTVRWHEVFVKRVTVDGRARVMALARDIHARKVAEEALAASEEQYRSMFNASIDGLALWNAQGEIVDTNPALWRMYGYGEDESALLRSVRGAAPSYNRAFIRLAEASESMHFEITEHRKDGSALELELHGIPMQYQGKRHVLAIARDITQKKRDAAELQRQSESSHQREKLAALGSLLAGVAHELNNPLSVVVARAVLLEERGDPTTRTAAVKIRTAAERCARIVRTFLAMARQQQPERRPVALNEVVIAALDIAGYGVRTSGIDVKLDLAPDIPLILADADQLHQVFLNLIINAQQSLQERVPPRRIEVTTRYIAGAAMLRATIADNGPGIPAHLRARIFDPYFTTKPTGVGTGVGLAVSLGIVEAHGGAMSVDCPSDGGAVFRVDLPVNTVHEVDDDDEACRDAPQPRTRAVANRRTILIVDDEADIRGALTEILDGALDHVVAVGSGREALERMEVEDYDAIITDIRMADMDGRMLYQEIERRWPRRTARVAFVTGDTLATGLREFVDASGRPVIEKPFLPSEVRRIVAELATSGIR